MLRHDRLRQAALFVGVSGVGWLLDTGVFLALSGPGGWPLLGANVVSGSCGALFVFACSARGIFRRNAGSMTAKVAALLGFNAVVIVASSVVLTALAAGLARMGAPAAWVPLGAKVLVTPVTLALNFVVVRYLLERFIGRLRPGTAHAAAVTR